MSLLPPWDEKGFIAPSHDVRGANLSDSRFRVHPPDATIVLVTKTCGNVKQEFLLPTFPIGFVFTAFKPAHVGDQN